MKKFAISLALLAALACAPSARACHFVSSAVVTNAFAFAAVVPTVVVPQVVSTVAVTPAVVATPVVAVNAVAVTPAVVVQKNVVVNKAKVRARGRSVVKTKTVTRVR